MAVNNSLAKKESGNGEIVFKANGENVRITPKMVKDYLVSGNGAVTDQEVVMFLSLCNYQHLNPFIREAYLIKYGNSPATVVVGKDVLLKRAMRSEKYEGSQAGVIVINGEGKVEEREGTFVIPGETLVGGWAKVYIKGYANPVYASVSMSEYSTGKSNWQTKPATMIRKVSLAQALREAFPEEMSNLYDQSEIKEAQVTESDKEIVLDETPVVMPSESPVVASEEAKVIEPTPVAEKPSKRTTNGQAGVEDIMFPDVLGGDMPTEI